MTLPFQCRCGGHDFLVIGKPVRLVPRRFLWLRWIAEVSTGTYRVMCSAQGCDRIWTVTMRGVEDSPAATPARRAEAPERHVGAAPPPQGEPEPRLPRDPLAHAVRRPEV